MKDITKAVVAFIIIVGLFFIYEFRDKSDNAHVKGTVLTDNAMRNVELKLPIKSAVVANRYNSELIRACGAADKIIAVDMGTAQDRSYWGMFSLDDVIGKGATELNYEKIIYLNPDVVILPANGSVTEAEEILAPFGIKVFVISGYDTADYRNQTLNIGKLFGTEEKAEKFYNYFNSKIEYINKSLEGVVKKKAYIETTTDYSTVIPGNYFYNMGVYAGADNIFSSNFNNISASKIDPEAVIVRNPDVIIKLITPKTVIAGTGVSSPPNKSEFMDTVSALKNRPGWDDITAVKNNDIYILTQFSHGGASKLVGSIYIAKWLYPDILQDIDPDEVFRAWMEDFQGMKYIDGHFYSAHELN